MTPRRIDRISAVIITRDAAETLAATLDSLEAFADVVVWDNGSRDETRAIAARYPNVTWHEGEFHGFGPAKNAACDCAAHDWVFSIDSDERMTGELAAAIAAFDTSATHSVGEVLRVNFFMGKAMHRGGWGNDRLVRLFHRGVHRFDNAAVHEKVALGPDSRVIPLAGSLEHEAVRELASLLQKADRYSEIRRRTMTRTYPAPIIFAKSLFAFFHSYVIRLGFLAGWRGLVIAWSRANDTFFKYFKIYADRSL